LSSPFLSIKEIADILECSYDYVSKTLDYKHNYKVVISLCKENEYYLFTDFLEKTIKTKPDMTIMNSFDFNIDEKMYLRGWGFKI